MIIQTGMRTDIPAFFSEWFLNRLKAGFVLVRNPYNESAVTRYELNPGVVDLIAFCTKNPGPMLDKLELLRDYGQFWFVTITPYDNDIERNVPYTASVIEDFKRLSIAAGIKSVTWRYDPVLINEKYSVQRHINDFESIARELSGFTDCCVISFVDLYSKVLRNFKECAQVSFEDKMKLGKAFAEIGARYGIKIKACGEGRELERFGIDCDGCMTVQTFEKALGCKLNVPAFKGKRAECSCLLGNDIGAYNSCMHLCRYCYANYDEKIVRENFKKHDSCSPFLIGNYLPGDIIHNAKQKSWKSDQLELF